MSLLMPLEGDEEEWVGWSWLVGDATLQSTAEDEGRGPRRTHTPGLIPKNNSMGEGFWRLQKQRRSGAVLAHLYIFNTLG